ncbi:uncharacterized protein N7482_003138 [Penicillium canariense]|uniref:DUF4048 domain-containing protein n=1 Tax=Penicillium canariense TaxID=189055 RepID=A0A9W9LUN9_9EURO|nr:uncharacterized protein N7482_003138 [Penicillium canariense]KAJ5177261.1 hypothetical protein N7482_003138 [Penicillium canariense]
MELSPGTGDDLIHGPPPQTSQTSTPMTTATTPASPVVDSPIQPDVASEEPSQSLSRSSSLLRQHPSSLPRAHSGARHTKRLTLNFPINIPLDQPPTAVSETSVSSPGSMTPVTQSSTRPSSALPAGAFMPLDADDDGYDFLRAIASQERRVMELREELHRAEVDLMTLKKQWAQSEKSKKRTEISHHAEPLLPLRSPDFNGLEGTASHRREQSLSSVGGSSVSQERVSRELDRRSSIRVASAKGTTISANGRRIFQGTHTRTLSLLSPVTASSPTTGDASLSEADRVGRTPRSATLPSVERNNVSSIGAPTDESQVPEHVLAQWRKNMPPPSREALVRTGKQMASDLREGLWTFFEDIRQATVGEEGINATESRTMSPSHGSLAPPNTRKRDSLAKSRSRDQLFATGTASRSSSSSSRGRGTAGETSSGKDTKPADISTSFWHEFGVDSPAQTSPRPGPRRSLVDNTIAATTPRGENEPEHPDHPSSSLVEVEDDTADNWDMWDTPLPASKMMHTPSSSRSTVESLKHNHSPATQGSSPRTSASFGEWNPSSAAPDPSVTEGIPWPTITKLAPSKLQRTASNLMAEWERSLSPSPERKDSSSGSSRGKNSKAD